MDFEALHASNDALEELAEEYIFDRLSQADLDAYEEHLLICETCRRAVETADEFVALLRSATDESGRPPQ
jgi:hypothetical protein